LVFCSGIDQINELTTYFGNKLNPILFKVHALHGKLSPEEQKEVFADTK
jgi:superfamily II DNA/RNA helicase